MKKVIHFRTLQQLCQPVKRALFFVVLTCHKPELDWLNWDYQASVHFSKQCHQWISTTAREQLLGMIRIEPRAAGWEKSMVPLCYAAPPPPNKHTWNKNLDRCSLKFKMGSTKTAWSIIDSFKMFSKASYSILLLSSWFCVKKTLFASRTSTDVLRRTQRALVWTSI